MLVILPVLRKKTPQLPFPANQMVPKIQDPEDPNFQVSVVTPVTTITTSYSPDYVFYSNRTGSISYNGSCVGNRTEAVVGNNTMKIYSASSTPPVYIPSPADSTNRVF